MKRRDFIKSTALMAVAAGTGNVVNAATLQGNGKNNIAEDKPTDAADGRLIISAPMLQNYAATSIGVAFAVSSMANGYVIIGEKADLSDGRKVMCGGYRTTDISDRVIQVRVTGLKPSTKYFYRIGADKIEYKGGYSMKILGNEEDSNVYSFTTAGKQSEAHFCVINDTHVNWDAFRLATDKVAALAPQCVIWNGDASNTEETIEAQMRIFLTPHIERKDYAAAIPYLFCPGNHDSRGMANRHLERVWMYRQPEERSSRDWDLGRNFAIRMGDIAMIGLDTAEDKLDTNPKFAGLFNSAAYREAQTEWLRNALKQKEIVSAPYLVAFCHIPLYDSDPRSNPGDVAPDDKDSRYDHDFAIWQRTCAKMWTPLLEKAGCQIIIAAHNHKFRYDEPTKERPWGHLVGGGPEKADATSPDKLNDKPDLFPTVIEGKIENGRLVVNTYNLRTGKLQHTVSFKKR